jgi:hypothetical protein
MVGHYSGKTVSNYVNGVRAWHIVHGAEWSLNDTPQALLFGTNNGLSDPVSMLWESSL